MEKKGTLGYDFYYMPQSPILSAQYTAMPKKACSASCGEGGRLGERYGENISPHMFIMGLLRPAPALQLAQIQGEKGHELEDKERDNIWPLQLVPPTPNFNTHPTLPCSTTLPCSALMANILSSLGAPLLISTMQSSMASLLVLQQHVASHACEAD